MRAFPDGGRIDAEVAFLERRGQIFTGEGMRARLVIQSPESRGIAGELHAEHHSPPQEWRDDPSAALARLGEILQPEAMEVEGDAFSPNRLLAELEGDGVRLVDAEVEPTPRIGRERYEEMVVGLEEELRGFVRAAEGWVAERASGEVAEVLGGRIAVSMGVGRRG